MMNDFDFLVAFIFACILIWQVTGMWYAIASWINYRFSPWWLLALIVLPLSIFFFPLYSELRFRAARKQGRPQEVISCERLYRRMSWIMLLCFMVTNWSAQIILHYTLPESDTNGLSVVFSTLSIGLASLAFLWIIGPNRTHAKNREQD